MRVTRSGQRWCAIAVAITGLKRLGRTSTQGFSASALVADPAESEEAEAPFIGRPPIYVARRHSSMSSSLLSGMIGIFQYRTDPLHAAIPAAGAGSVGDSD
jgi:hypothetical protein